MLWKIVISNVQYMLFVANEAQTVLLNDIILGKIFKKGYL